jgi:hypothetical protein
VARSEAVASVSADASLKNNNAFQASLAGLYVTGLPATRDFGPFFSVTVGCFVAAKIIGDAVVARSVGVL